ncbi:ABC transporter ATP-binding protein [Adhaeribacter pallidiroseus]|uniref:Lipid A export ATP-binding/permease protein MsbA n=1 Tax=Adhaeribacter pallidiroseus TaxID=2072847 RepID=A0A369QD47_9BACT|nr:ABC transporter ATP-binding protein [Adhaeribacter pallidiroseus]RDC62260.1 Lipid A export ATP-binding/permease protein MsbA [Adhaeribacter pallidiroseus]
MRVLWHYLQPHRQLVFSSLLLAAASQILTLLDPVIFGKIIDNYATPPYTLPAEERVQGALWLMFLAVIVALLARLAKSFQEYLTNLVVQKFGVQIFNDGLKQTLRLSYQEYANQNSGETLSILQRVRRDTERFISAFINILFSSVVGVCFLVWYAITKHWALVPVFIVGIFVLGGLTSLLSAKIKTMQRSINRATNKMAGFITESLRNIELIKSLGLTFQEIRRLRGHTEQIFSLEMEKVKRVRTLSFLQGTSLNLLKQSILFTLLWLIFREVLSTGELISMQFISVSIFGPLQDLGTIILAYREADAALINFDELLRKPIENRPESAIDIGPLYQLRFEQVVFCHQNASQNAINDISFTANTGDTLAFVGPSGSGKSTLVKLLVGLYVPVSGEIRYNNYSAKTIWLNEARRQLGFVTQETNLFSGTIKENLLLVKPDATDAEIMAALGKAACTNLLARSDLGIDTPIGEGGLKMSGGEKQRLSIARALIRNPRLLIFDEATSALDSLTEEEITNTVREISAQREQITVLIAHRLSTILHADIIYVLEKGKIVEKGSHADLLTQKSLYYAMWRQQIGERR